MTSSETSAGVGLRGDVVQPLLQESAFRLGEGRDSREDGAKDPQRIAAFWALALGYVLEPGFAGSDNASLIDPEGNELCVA